MSRHKRNHLNGSKQHHHNNSPSRHDVLSLHSNDMLEHSLHPHSHLNSQRHRRDLSKCLGTHKQRRRLSIGCSRDDIVEVHPQCSEAGDEGTEICFFQADTTSPTGARGNFRGSLVLAKSFEIPFSFPTSTILLSLASIMTPTLPSDFSVQSLCAQNETKKPKRWVTRERCVMLFNRELFIWLWWISFYGNFKYLEWSVLIIFKLKK